MYLTSIDLSTYFFHMIKYIFQLYFVIIIIVNNLWLHNFVFENIMNMEEWFSEFCGLSLLIFSQHFYQIYWIVLQHLLLKIEFVSIIKTSFIISKPPSSFFLALWMDWASSFLSLPSNLDFIETIQFNKKKDIYIFSE